MVVSLILAGVLLLIGFVAATQFFGHSARAGRESGRFLEELTVENNHSPHKIAVIDVEGIITSQAWDRSGRNMVDLIEDELRFAARDDSVKAVVLKVDSPGGEVLASDDISRAIIDFQDKHNKPVIAAMGGLAASGGYYVSAPCQWIVANELTITGSIGVIMHSFNYRGLLDKVGLYPQVFKSGKFKDMLSGSKKLDEVDPEEHKMIQAMIEETYKKFTSVVAKGRQRAAELNQGDGRKLAANWEQVADGRVFTGKQAYEYGFVDETGNFDTAVARARKLANISSANLIRYQEPFNIAQLFSLFGKSDATTLKVDLGMEMPKLSAGRLYFLSSTVLH
jgi:protease IV